MSKEEYIEYLKGIAQYLESLRNGNRPKLIADIVRILDLETTLVTTIYQLENEEEN